MRKLCKLMCLACLLTILLCASVFHASASELVASGYCGGEGDGTNLTWELTEDGTLTISGSGAMENYAAADIPWKNSPVTIRKAVINNGVTSISDHAFRGCTMLGSLSIPQSVTRLGKYMVYGCQYLYGPIIIPDGVTVIEDYAFAGSFIRDITIGENVLAIGEGAFSSCLRLGSITIPESVTTIGDYAFRETPLYSFTIPSGVTSIGKRVFYECEYLERINTSADNLYYTDYDGVLFNKDATELICFPEGKNLLSYMIPDGVLTIGEDAFRRSSLKTVAISDSVTTIGDCAFYGCGELSNIIIGDGVTSIGDNAFSGCKSLENVNIPDSVVTIGTYAFYECKNLMSITIGNGVTSIGASAFSYCSGLETITLGNSLTTIGMWAFSECDKLTSLVLPDSLQIIGERAFAESGITEVVFGENTTSIGNYAFNKCLNLRMLKIPGSVTEIGQGAFNGCTGLTSLEIENGVERIKSSAFNNCTALSSVMIGDSVSYIGTGTFENCTSLTTIIMPSGLTYLCDEAFEGCSALTDAYFKGDAPDEHDTPSYDYYPFPEAVTIHYIPGTYGWDGYWYYGWDKYEQVVWEELFGAKIGDSYYGNLSEAIEVAEEDEVIVLLKENDESIVINKVLTIERNGFTASGLTAGEGFILTATEDNYIVGLHPVLASGYCGGEGDGTNLSWVLKRDSVLTVSGIGAMGDFGSHEMPWYEHRRNIKTVVIDDGVTTIGSCAFFACQNLSDVMIGNDVTTIGSGAFNDCGLKEVTIPDSVTTIQSSAFFNCDWLVTLSLGSGLTSIGSDAFYGCSRLVSVVIPSSVNRIANNVFRSCSSLTSITVDVENQTYCDVNGVLFNKDKTQLISYPCKKGESYYEVPAGVTTIGNEAFYYCFGLTDVVIPDSVTVVGRNALYDSDLTSVYFEGNAPSIDAETSSNRSFYTGTTLYYTFNTTGWTDSVAYDAEAGTWNGYKLAVWKKMLASGYCGGEGDGTNLTWELAEDGTLTISGIGAMANYNRYSDVPWYSCSDSITSVVIAEGVVTIGEEAFNSCDNLAELTISSTVKTIGDWAFASCEKLTEVLIPEGVITVGHNAFWSCSSLVAVTIPSSLTDVNLVGFDSCNSLTNITVAEENPSYSDVDGVLFNKEKTELLRYPSGRTESSYIVPDGVITIGWFSFGRCHSLTSVTIPASVTAIEGEAFAHTGLQTAYFEGNAPAVEKTYVPKSEPSDEFFDEPVIVSDSFAEDCVFYYIPGMTGWTDSEAYDAEAGTWNGNKLEVWEEKCAVAGDINGDGETNLKDLTRLFQYLADWEVEVNEAVLDVNGDGSVNLKDQTRLFQYLADWDVEIYGGKSSGNDTSTDYIPKEDVVEPDWG